MDPKPETPGNGNAPEDPKVGKSEDSGSFTVEVPPTPEQLKAMTEAQKIERLKSFHLKLFPDQTLYSCYERAYDLISYFQIFQHVLEVIRDNIPKDKTTPLWKAARVFFKSFNTGFIAFWTAMREDMIYLRDNFKYASVTSIVLLPTDAPKPISGFDDEDEVIGDMSLPPSPSTEGKEKPILKIVFKSLEMLCRKYPALHKVSPKVPVSWAQILSAFIESGKVFYTEYFGEPPVLKGQKLLTGTDGEKMPDSESEKRIAKADAPTFQAESMMKTSMPRILQREIMVTKTGEPVPNELPVLKKPLFLEQGSANGLD